MQDKHWSFHEYPHFSDEVKLNIPFTPLQVRVLELRLVDPCKKQLDPKVSHSIVHLLRRALELMFEDNAAFVYPLGSLTGFEVIYIMTQGYTIDKFNLIDIALERTLKVPSEWDCAAPSFHDFKEAKRLLRVCKEIVEEEERCSSKE